MGNILHRIELLTKNEGITITALERKIGASKGVLSRALNNNTDIQAKWLQAVVENYPLYSAEWILTGQGSMLKEESPGITDIGILDNIRLVNDLIDKIGLLSIQLGEQTKENQYLHQKNMKLQSNIDELKKMYSERVGYSRRDPVHNLPDIAAEPGAEEQ